MVTSDEFSERLVELCRFSEVIAMLPIAEVEGASALLMASANRHRKTRDRVVSAEVRAVRRRRGWTVVGSETR